MKLITIDKDIESAADVVVKMGTQSDFQLSKGVTVSATEEFSVAVSGDGSHQEATIAGIVKGDYGIWLGTEDELVIDNHLTLQKSALIDGRISAVIFSGTENTVENAGTIHGKGTAIALNSEEEYFKKHYGSHVYDDVSTAGNDNLPHSSVSNSGKIRGKTFAIEAHTRESIFIDNSGMIQGTKGDAISLDAGYDRMTNSGTIKGTVELNEGKDRYDGREGGKAFDGIYGGDGRDVLLGGKYKDRFFGDNGNDGLNGGGGADRLDGGNGKDRLTGGTGNDYLTGGKGDDVFVFTPKFGKDHITDFDHNDDVIDLLGLKLDISFKELLAHHTAEKHGNVLITFGTSTIEINDTDKTDLNSHNVLI